MQPVIPAYTLKGVVRIGKSYYFTFYNRENKREVKEHSKLGLISSIKEKIKLIKNRDEYGISTLTALRADTNIIHYLTKKDKEEYLAYIENPENNERPFEIDYDKPSRYYAMVLRKVEERALLSEPSIIEGEATGRDEFMEMLQQGTEEPIQTPMPRTRQVNRDNVEQENGQEH